jgi:hypothetical protein
MTSEAYIVDAATVNRSLEALYALVLRRLPRKTKKAFGKFRRDAKLTPREVRRLLPII